MWTSLPKLFETVCLHLVKGCKDKVSPSGRLRWKWRLSGKIFFFSRQQPTLAILQPDDAERSYSTNTLKMTYLLGMIDPNDHMSRWTWQKQYFKEEVLTYILQPPDPWTPFKRSNINAEMFNINFNGFNTCFTPTSIWPRTTTAFIGPRSDHSLCMSVTNCWN